LLVITPTSRHLAELVRELGLLAVDDRKDERLAKALEPHLAPEGTSEHTYTMKLSPTEIATVVGMGPSAWHTDPQALAERIAALPNPAPVTASVLLSRYVADPSSG
jgi:23S rRNA (guanine745-N1)-methyltransferase